MKNTYYIKVNSPYGFFYSRTTDDIKSFMNGFNHDTYYIDEFSTYEDAEEFAQEIWTDDGYTISDIFEPESYTVYEDNLLAENQIT
jgi:hypothetical protein